MKSDSPLLIEDGYAYNRSGLAHRVWEPDGDGPHPTIVMLHGRSGTEDVTWVFARTLPKEWLVVAPRALYSDPRGGYSWDVRRTGEWPPIDAFDDGVEALHQFIMALPALYAADLGRLYLLGFSQGAGLGYVYTMRHRSRVQAIAGLVGLMPVGAQADADLANLRDLPVLMAVGREDETVPRDVALACAQTLLLGGARLDYREYDTGHKLNARGMRDLAAWWQRVTQEEAR